MSDTPCGIIEIDLFPEWVDGAEHPEAVGFRRLLEETAREHACRVLSFEVRRGTVSFALDSEELTAKIVRILACGGGDQP